MNPPKLSAPHPLGLLTRECGCVRSLAGIRVRRCAGHAPPEKRTVRRRDRLDIARGNPVLGAEIPKVTGAPSD